MTNDPNFEIEVHRLHKLTIYGRWLTVIFLWISIGSLSIWGLRDEIALWIEHLTWAAVRYGLYFHRWPTLGLGLCLGMTFAVLTWQGRNLVWGLPLREKQRLEQQVRRIREQGQTHPLWKWVCRF
ncbi:hypothetical protein [Tychonema sp. BBK16]|uniref:hypothetical protein n=1 Tax=Tychonema sp. BBK16 TaxID=2699888 RepID=UPI001F30EC2F|nr:hypothetical protein [Tychonema sp. BBK16]MCF6374633.1 hypothetical protein [Tychonema sp. BBK16]